LFFSHRTMQGSFFAKSIQNIVDKKVQDTSEMFYRETDGNKTKLFACTSSMDGGGEGVHKLTLSSTGELRPIKKRREKERSTVAHDDEKWIETGGETGVKPENDDNKVKTENGDNKVKSESGSGSESESIYHSGYGSSTEEDEPKHELSKNRKKDKEYVILVSGFVSFKDFSKLWAPSVPLLMGGVDMHSTMERAIRNLIKKILEKKAEEGVKFEYKDAKEMHKILLDLWKYVDQNQERLLDYGVSEIVKAGETRVIHRLYDSGLFSFIFEGDDPQKLRENFIKYLRRSDLTKTMFSETVGLYICWNGITINNRSTINEQRTMLQQFHTSFQIFGKFLRLRQSFIRRELGRPDNELFED